MKIQLMKYGRKWSLYGVLLTAMAYAALMLNSEPAYAATCTAAQCNNFSGVCSNFCSHQFGVMAYACDTSHAGWLCVCFDHVSTGGSC